MQYAVCGSNSSPIHLNELKTWPSAYAFAHGFAEVGAPPTQKRFDLLRTTQQVARPRGKEKSPLIPVSGPKFRQLPHSHQQLVLPPAARHFKLLAHPTHRHLLYGTGNPFFTVF